MSTALDASELTKHGESLKLIHAPGNDKRIDGRNELKFESKPEVLATMFAGGIAGCVSKTVMAPLSRLTILYQVDTALHPTDVPSSSSIYSSLTTRTPSNILNMSQLLRKIINEEGFLSLWKGNFTSVIHRFPYSAINFSVFEKTKELLKAYAYDSNEETLFMRFLSGAVGGAAACIACYPLDLVRTRLTVRPNMSTISSQSVNITPAFNLSIRNSAIFSTFQDIIEKEGLRGLYRGLFVSLSVCVPNLAVGFSTYGTAKDFLLLYGNLAFINPERHKLTMLGTLTCGAVSGIMSSILVFPADVIRRRMQVRGLLESSSLMKLNNHDHNGNLRPLSIGVIGEIRLLWLTEGVRGFYRGLAPELLKVTPAVGVTFCVYEFFLQLFRQLQ